MASALLSGGLNILQAHTVMAYIFMPDIVMAYMAVTYVCSHGLYSPGLWGQYSYGLC